MEPRPPIGNHVGTADGDVVQVGILNGDINLSHRRPVPRQLPPLHGPLFGRDDHLARLDDTVSHGRVAVLTGMAGIGKTALAVAWAHRAASAFPDGQLFVNLRGHSLEAPVDPHEVLARFLRALGQPRPDNLAGTDERAAAFRTLTSGYRMLVVLDNVATVAQIRPLIPGSRTCAVIVTSRTDLHGLALHHSTASLRLERLTGTDAAAILEHAIGARATRDPAGRDSLARHCSGLPLALRIAGTRAASTPGSDLRAANEELADAGTLDFLDVGDDESSALRTVFSWSYRRLSAIEKQAFRAFGVHPGPSIDAYALATALDRDHAAAVDALRMLAGKHLVTRAAGGHFAMHDLLRAYAAELGAAEHTTVLARLYDYYLDVADRADDIVSSLRYRLTREHPPRPAPALTDRFTALIWLGAELPTLTALCARDDPVHDDCRWRLAYAIRGYLYLTKQHDAWLRTHTAALTAATRLADGRAEGFTRNNLGMALVATGRLAAAEINFTIAHRLFERSGDDHNRVSSLANLASVYRRRGRLDDALRNLREALAYYRLTGYTRHACITLRSIASVETDLGRFSDAIAHVQEAASIALGLGLELEAAQAFNSLGVTYTRTGDIVHAQIAHHVALHYSCLTDSTHQRATSLRRLGQAAIAEGDRRRARQWLSSALKLFRDIGAAEAETVAAELARLHRGQDHATAMSTPPDRTPNPPR
ncbi:MULTISPECIES: ATP-binding protein [Amycolatopsis]|uniref:ATP-binding protein n=1 Tax=Amycolatopsis albidoflavus TaxID=102226 RepID=A0ABW5HWM6_9PSEU